MPYTEIFNKITEDEKMMIEDYIMSFSDTNASGDCTTPMADFETVFEPWASEKHDWLFEILGKELIISKEVEVSMSATELESNMAKIKYGINTPASDFLNRYHQTFCLYNSENYSKEASYYLMSLVSPSVLAKNIYEEETFFINNPKTNKPFKIQQGCKASKTIAKLAEMYDIEGIEDFRTAHSQALNQKTLKGELCLSIHPLDYMTMSDNDNDWSSCMNWKESGCYRQGTVEMMNSPYVVVAYLKSKNSEMTGFPYNLTWNNKKWRELYIVSNEIITNIKGYPYQSNELTGLVMDWLRELVEPFVKLGEKKYEFEGYDIEEENVRFDPCTHYMYNDFSTYLHHQAFLGEDYLAYVHEKGSDIMTFRYSGVSECMRCGQTGILVENEGQLLCSDCQPLNYCDVCGCAISEYEVENYYADGYTCCESCFNDRFVEDIITGELKFDENVQSVCIMLPKGSIYLYSDIYANHYATGEEIAEALNNPEMPIYNGLFCNVGNDGKPSPLYGRRYCTYFKAEDFNDDSDWIRFVGRTKEEYFRIYEKYDDVSNGYSSYSIMYLDKDSTPAQLNKYYNEIMEEAV